MVSVKSIGLVAFLAAFIVPATFLCAALPDPQPAAAAKAFEVATIRPLDPAIGHEIGIDVFPAGRIKLNGLPLKTMICAAFNLSYWQLAGGDKWMDKNLYDVEAIPPKTDPAISTRHTLFGVDDERLREMLQALLTERFNLRYHMEETAGKVYLLEKTEKVKLVGNIQSSPSSLGSIGFAEQWVLDDVTMPQLARFASNYVLHCPVLDRTGLQGSFNYRSAPEDSATYRQDQTGSFLTLVRDLGLKLQPSRGPLPMLVIDGATLPSPN